MDNDPILQVPADRPGQHGTFYVTAEAAQVIDRAPVVDPDDVLLDDRPRVQFGGHVVGGCADELDPPRGGLAIRVGARERWQEAVVDVDDRPGELGQEVRREDLHVPGQDHQVGLCLEQAELGRLGLVLGLGRDRDVVERDAPPLCRLLGVRVVGDDHPDVGPQLAALRPPEDLLERVIGPGHHDRDALEVGGPGQAPAHGELVGQGGEPLLLVGGQAAEPVTVELEPEEERAAERVGGVLLRFGDVRAVVEQELGYGGDDAGAVRAGDQQPADVGVPIVRLVPHGERAPARGSTDTGFHLASFCRRTVARRHFATFRSTRQRSCYSGVPLPGTLFSECATRQQHQAPRSDTIFAGIVLWPVTNARWCWPGAANGPGPAPTLGPLCYRAWRRRSTATISPSQARITPWARDRAWPASSAARSRPTPAAPSPARSRARSVASGIVTPGTSWARNSASSKLRSGASASSTGTWSAASSAAIRRNVSSS